MPDFEDWEQFANEHQSYGTTAGIFISIVNTTDDIEVAEATIDELATVTMTIVPESTDSAIINIVSA